MSISWADRSNARAPVPLDANEEALASFLPAHISRDSVLMVHISRNGEFVKSLLSSKSDDELAIELVGIIKGCTERFGRKYHPPRAKLRERSDRVMADAENLSGAVEQLSKSLAAQSAVDLLPYFAHLGADGRYADFFRAAGEIGKDIAAGAGEARSRHARRGNPIDENRAALGWELASIWWGITAKMPTGSKSGDVDRPNTEFGQFLKRALALSPATRPLLDGDFPGFVLDAAMAYRTDPPPGVLIDQKKSDQVT